MSKLRVVGAISLLSICLHRMSPETYLPYCGFIAECVGSTILILKSSIRHSQPLVFLPLLSKDSTTYVDLFSLQNLLLNGLFMPLYPGHFNRSSSFGVNYV
jgi:hypothetical protein